MPGGHGAGCGADLTRLPESRGVFPARGHLESEHHCAPFSCRLHGCDAAWPPPGPARPQNPVRGPAWAAASSCRPRPGALDVLVWGRGATAGRGFSALSLRTEQDSRPLGFAPRRREAQSSVQATAESGRPLVPTLGDDGEGVRASWFMCIPYFRTTPKVHLDIPAQEKGPWQTLARTIYLLGREKCSGRAWRGGRGDRAVPVPHPTGRSPPGMAGVPGVAAPTPALRRPEVSGMLTLSREAVHAGRV